MTLKDDIDNHQPLQFLESVAHPGNALISIDEIVELANAYHDAQCTGGNAESDGMAQATHEDEANLDRYNRQLALQLGVQVDSHRISLHAQNGGTWNSDPVGLAEAFYAFLSKKPGEL